MNDYAPAIRLNQYAHGVTTEFHVEDLIDVLNVFSARAKRITELESENTDMRKHLRHTMGEVDKERKLWKEAQEDLLVRGQALKELKAEVEKLRQQNEYLAQESHESDAQIDKLRRALETSRDGPHDPNCGFCLGRIESAEKALR